MIKASDGTGTYVVTTMAQECQDKRCVPQCTAPECTFLCRHQIKCTCVDYQEGHLCKHTHKVRALSNSAGCDTLCSNDTTKHDQIIFSPECGGIKVKGYKVVYNITNDTLYYFLDAMIEAKRSSLQSEAERVHSLTRFITDTHILDHALATLGMLTTGPTIHRTKGNIRFGIHHCAHIYSCSEE